VTEPIPLSAVGRTALAVSLARAVESERPDAWFDDPLARGLASRSGAAGDAINAGIQRIGEGLRSWVAVRTRFLDDVVLASMGEGIRQVVIVGAGLDARSFRLPLPDGTTVFEVDRDDVLAVKQRVVDAAALRPRGRRLVVVGDVTDPGWLGSLEHSGWRSGEPTLWILEGFLIYFEAEVRTRILSELSAVSATGSRLGATVSTRAGAPDNPLWYSFTSLDFVSWFAECGWAANATTMAERSESYGRPISVEVDQFAGVLIDAQLLAAGG
jgi:methyltransferase (TIGR00027 family)